MADGFDLTEQRLVWIEVRFAGFASEGDQIGQPVEHVVELQVDLVDLDEFARLFVSPLDADGEPLENAHPPATPERIAEWRTIDDTVRALAIVHGWRKVKAGRTPVPFTPENLRKMMRVPNFGLALWRTAYPAAYAGMKDTRLGNSGGSAENGPPDAAEPQ